MRVSHPSPPTGNRQENLGRLVYEGHLVLQREHQIAVPFLPARPGKQISGLLRGKPATLRGRTVPLLPGSAQSGENLLRSSVAPSITEYLTIIVRPMSTAQSRMMGHAVTMADPLAFESASCQDGKNSWKRTDPSERFP
jgi:hypothetical protein